MGTRQYAKRRDKIQPFRGSDKKWNWRLIAPNGEILAPSQGYSEGVKCLSTIQGFMDRNPTIVFKPPAPEDKKAWAKATYGRVTDFWRRKRMRLMRDI